MIVISLELVFNQKQYNLLIITLRFLGFRIRVTFNVLKEYKRKT